VGLTIDTLLAEPIANRKLQAWCRQRGLHHEAINRIRSGRTKRPCRGTVLVLAKAFGVTEKRMREAIDGSLRAAAIRATVDSL
jgi:hypothetical protein